MALIPDPWGAWLMKIDASNHFYRPTTHIDTHSLPSLSSLSTALVHSHVSYNVSCVCVSFDHWMHLACCSPQPHINSWCSCWLRNARLDVCIGIIRWEGAALHSGWQTGKWFIHRWSAFRVLSSKSGLMIQQMIWVSLILPCYLPFQLTLRGWL